MTREEAEAELGHRYRIRIRVELQHQDLAGGLLQLKGATMVESPKEIGVGLIGLVELMAPRLLHAAMGGTADGKEEGRQGREGAARVQSGDAALGIEEGAGGEFAPPGHRHRP